MISGVNSALSALQAFGTKIESNGNNIANSNTDGFKRTRVTLTNVEPNGVKANVDKMETPGPITYNQEGEQTELSNVDLGVEIPDMMINSNYYKANLKTLQVADELTQSVLDLKA